jgi:hypothetical protein
VPGVEWQMRVYLNFFVFPAKSGAILYIISLQRTHAMIHSRLERRFAQQRTNYISFQLRENELFLRHEKTLAASKTRMPLIL